MLTSENINILHCVLFPVIWLFTTVYDVMAHWFHRNPLKATSPENFEMKDVLTTTQARKLCSELKQARGLLLDIVANPNNDMNTLDKSVDSYLALTYGFITSLDPDKPGDSKLRHAVKFRWTNTLLGSTPTEQHDVLFDVISMMFNVGLWYMKHAAKYAGKDEPSMEEAKEVHKCLRTAAGVFTYIQDQLVGKLIETPEKGTDLDPRVLSAYISQCTAEAQEVTIARAIEMKHSPSIVSALAYETAKMYTSVEDSLSTFEEKISAKWRKYCQFKVAIYYAYAYSYHGEQLLAEDKCGEAIRCLQESQKYYQKSEATGREYAATKGAGTTAKPTNHLFFRKLAPIVRRTLEKCERENGFIYHQKVPPNVADLELKATYGLAAPQDFTQPEKSAVWTADAYKSFDITQKTEPDPKEKGKKKEKEGDLPPVKEADIPQSNKDPNNSSGCVVS